MSTVPTVSTGTVQSKQNPSCCETVKQALGRTWQWIKDCWHWLVHRVFRTVDAVAFGFFRVVEWFSPSLARRMEASYGYLATWYTRHTAAVQEEILQTQIAGLEDENRSLNQRVQKVSTDAAQLQVAHSQTTKERDRLKSEREADIRAKNEAEAQRKQAQVENQFIAERNQSLQNEISRLQKELEVLNSKSAADADEKDRLEDERDNLSRSITQLNMQLQNAQRERDLSYSALQLFGRMGPPTLSKRPNLPS